VRACVRACVCVCVCVCVHACHHLLVGRSLTNIPVKRATLKEFPSEFISLSLKNKGEPCLGTWHESGMKLYFHVLDPPTCKVLKLGGDETLAQAAAHAFPQRNGDVFLAYRDLNCSSAPIQLEKPVRVGNSTINLC